MDDNRNIFGERLRILRNLNGKRTQKEFAQELGIPQPTISAYENGSVNPTIDMVCKIADKCDVSIDWLCGRDDNIKMKNMGDVMEALYALYTTKEFRIETIVHDKVDIEDTNSTDDNERNWVAIKVYHNEIRNNPEFVFNLDLAKIITKVNQHTNSFRRFELNQEIFDREKAYSIERMRNLPTTQIDISDLSEEERRKKLIEIVMAEQEVYKKKE